MLYEMPSRFPSTPARAPGAGLPSGHRAPTQQRAPCVDDHVVRPETREEMVRGRVLHAVPANPPHADAHVDVAFAVRGLARPGYTVADDLLTRFAERSDFASDLSVRKAGTDSSTGERYLEELAFEVVNTQSEHDITERAEDMTARGVRRMFAIFVKRREVAEWSPVEGRFQPLPADGRIEDECLVAPLPVRALLDAASSEEAGAVGLLLKKNPVVVRAVQEGIAETRRESQAEGRRQGLLEAIEIVCDALGLELSAERRASLGPMDAAALKWLLARIQVERRWPG